MSKEDVKTFKCECRNVKKYEAKLKQLNLEIGGKETNYHSPAFNKVGFSSTGGDDPNAKMAVRVDSLSLLEQEALILTKQIEWVYEAARSCPFITRTYIEQSVIGNESRNAIAEMYHMNPKSLSRKITDELNAVLTEQRMSELEELHLSWQRLREQGRGI